MRLSLQTRRTGSTRGVLKIDATCADAEVRYPVDSTLLETACRKIDEYTSKVCKEFGIAGRKTHYKDARRAYLLLIKQKVKKGRPPKDPPPEEVKARMDKAVGERNEIECSFGTGKRVYRANDIRAKLPDTARCWTGMCYFVKNVMKFLRELCHALIELLHLIMNIVTGGGYVCTPVVVTRN